MKIYIGDNLGCGLNYQYNYITSKLSEKFEIINDPSIADVILFLGTCSATETHIFNMMLSMDDVISKKKKEAKVYITGCITRKFKNNPTLNKVRKWLEINTDAIIPQNNPDQLLQLISKDDFTNSEEEVSKILTFPLKHVASLYIGNGCLNHCSFCKTTFQKYPLKSVSIEVVKKAIDSLEEYDISSLYFKATNISQYGYDLNQTYMLPQVVEYLEKKDTIENAYFVGFCFADAIKQDFAPMLRDSTKVTGISGSIESGSPRILQLTRKCYTPEKLIQMVDIIREKHWIDLYLNIISGFPTETQEDVLETLNLLERLNPKQVVVSPYVNSSFVDSNKFEQLSPEIIEEHTKIYEKTLKSRNIEVIMN